MIIRDNQLGIFLLDSYEFRAQMPPRSRRAQYSVFCHFCSLPASLECTPHLVDGYHFESSYKSIDEKSAI